MTRWHLSYPLALALAAGCLLPDVSVDPSLDVDVDALNGGASGSGGAGGTSAAPVGLGDDTVETLCPLTTDPEQACAQYCDLYTRACSNFANVYDYANANDCAVTCYQQRWPIGTTSEKGSIMCRCYHSSLALTEGQTPHCYHAAKNPTMGGCQLLP